MEKRLLVCVGSGPLFVEISYFLLLPTQLLPDDEKAMMLWVTRNIKINAENKAKISITGAKHVPVPNAAASKPGLMPRIALGNIGNKDREQPQAKLPLKKEAKTAVAGKVIAKKLPKPLEKALELVPVTVLESAPEPEPEPVHEEKRLSQPVWVDTPSPSPMKTSGCTPAENIHVRLSLV